MYNLGTVIEGTLRPEDLAQAFIDELAKRNPTDALHIAEIEYPDILTIWDAAEDSLTIEVSHASEDIDELDELVNEVLFDALNDAAPEGTYFGAHPGDGSDFGFWPIEEED